MNVRAGVVPLARTALYAATAVVVGLVVLVFVVAVFGVNRIVTGLIVGFVIGTALYLTLATLHRITLTDDAITVRELLRKQVLSWDDVVGCRFEVETHPEPHHRRDESWLLALYFGSVGAGGGGLALAVLEPVTHPYTNAREMHQREMIESIFAMARRKSLDIRVSPSIAAAVQQHWKITI
ncbi:PH domain-containing protein [Antrihabitans sp. NCIMB 15449]|uniref:PH domain-containing protein n=1 Tax=Antrihabitans spumae TaxID=3373370 RepID=A0ABW7JU22_9NOCA